MVDNSRVIPEKLTTAHAKLSRALTTARKQCEIGKPDTRELPSLIQTFVDSLYQTQGGHDELRRRAELIVSLCGPGSEFARALDAAVVIGNGCDRPRQSVKAM